MGTVDRQPRHLKPSMIPETQVGSWFKQTTKVRKETDRNRDTERETERKVRKAKKK